MKLLSVNVGLPRPVEWKGETVTTGIFKEPVTGPVRVGTLNLEGDRQADLSVHGGWEKAVYAYPMENYRRWRELRPDLQVGPATFGENLTTEGIREDDLNVGDRLRIGTAEFVVTEPRLPCFKLGIKMGSQDFVPEFLERGMYGFYLAVAQQGDIEAGDEVEIVARDPARFPVSDIARLYSRDREDVDGLCRAVATDSVPESWRSHFRDQLTRLERRRGEKLLPPMPEPAWPGFRRFVVAERVAETRDVASFHLRPEDGGELPAYQPGQYLTLRLAVPGTEPAIRSYSLSDAAGSGTYRLTIKRVAPQGAKGRPGVASGYLHDSLTVGDVIEVKAPAGRFTIDVRESHRPVVLVAGGIGITPLLAMLNAIVGGEAAERETWLFYGVRNHDDHVQAEHLRAIADAHPHVHLHVAYSRPLRRNGSTLGSFDHAGRVNIDLLRQVLPASYYDFYICGPPGMTEELTQGLAEWGVPDHRIHLEAFGPAAVRSRAPQGQLQPDCGVDVTFARSGVMTAWSRCDSPLLELAEENGLSIPYGCRAGSCGTCVTTLISGHVEYLEEPGAPLAAGEILPCVAVPTSPVVLDA
jgi:ferredoxin-NADP reductase/MOSC domain-containing protein YiiM